MATPTKFEFARPITPRVVEIDYISPPVIDPEPLSGSGDDYLAPSIL